MQQGSCSGPSFNVKHKYTSLELIGISENLPSQKTQLGWCDSDHQLAEARHFEEIPSSYKGYGASDILGRGLQRLERRRALSSTLVSLTFGRKWLENWFRLSLVVSSTERRLSSSSTASTKWETPPGFSNCTSRCIRISASPPKYFNGPSSR